MMKNFFLPLLVIALFISCDDPVDEPLLLNYADVDVNIVTDNLQPEYGDTVRLTITVANSGYDDTEGFSLNTYLPDGLTYVSSAVTRGTYDEANDVWNMNRLYGNSSEVMIIDLTVSSTGLNFIFSAEVASSSVPDPDSTPGNADVTEDDFASLDSSPILPIDLSISLVVDNAFPQSGDTVTFTAEVQNTGASEAYGVKLALPLPSGFTYVSDTSGGLYVSNEWIIGTIAIGGTVNMDIEATVNATGDYVLTSEINAAVPYDADSTVNNGELTEDDYASLTIIPVINTIDDALNVVLDTVTTLDVMANDTHVPTDGTLVVTSNPTNGTLVLTDPAMTPNDPTDDVLTYTPNLGYTGADSFSYTICDTMSPQHCDTATVTVTIN